MYSRTVENMLDENFRQAGLARKRVVEEIKNESVDFMRGYVQAFESGSVVGKFLGALLAPISPRRMKYDLAKYILSKNALSRMSNADLTDVAGEKLGFFTSSNRVYRQNVALDIVESRFM